MSIYIGMLIYRRAYLLLTLSCTQTIQIDANWDHNDSNGKTIDFKKKKKKKPGLPGEEKKKRLTINHYINTEVQ